LQLPGAPLLVPPLEPLELPVLDPLLLPLEPLTHVPEGQVCPEPHAAQVLPPIPHCSASVPAWQLPPGSQHPLHVLLQALPPELVVLPPLEPLEVEDPELFSPLSSAEVCEVPVSSSYVVPVSVSLEPLLAPLPLPPLAVCCEPLEDVDVPVPPDVEVVPNPLLVPFAISLATSGDVPDAQETAKTARARPTVAAMRRRGSSGDTRRGSTLRLV
jgi:hypothetical protein